MPSLLLPRIKSRSKLSTSKPTPASTSKSSENATLTPPQIRITPSAPPPQPSPAASSSSGTPLRSSQLPSRSTSYRLRPKQRAQQPPPPTPLKQPTLEADTMSLSARRSSMASPIPPPTPGSAIPRPASVTGHHYPRARRNSDATSVAGDVGGSGEGSSVDPDQRNVRVVLRVRPSDPDDASVPPRFRQTLVHPVSPSDVRVDVDPATLAGHSGSVSAGTTKRHPTFTYDHVLGEEASQVDLYDATARDVVDEFMKGHNVTFLAYGQTSSGKSYSMGTTGEDADYTGTEWNDRTGLIPRTVQAIFDQAEAIKQSSGPGASFEARLSFLELYNEEIIDLLSGTGISISIREERDGRIVWSGVREVKVRDLAEVMQLLYEGSARRKTGETGMNATSSRSHAIFSLTLVQRKRPGGLQASTSQPINNSDSVNGRTLKRPSSTLGFAASRSNTPSGSRPPPSSFQKNGTVGGRPTSFMGPAVPQQDGDLVIVTSKFNMVDLAGSERLKRTAAQGDRMREGISINSGLLALGNVISHLADPVKSKGHIPYRDSKLTRMLQDSIGGNSLTTMIACVSSIEYNVVETINTLKYASRARNIKNTSRVNAVEAGWDDVEHLQTTVLKLRKQIAALESEDGGGRNIMGRGNEKLIQRLADLQREHTELYDRYLAKCSESMRLTSELKNAKPGDADALAKFNETVEPVIIEYEKVVSALNRQLDGLRAELTSISDLYEEQGVQLKEVQERQIEHDAYVTELRNRVNKMTERNSSSEVYIQDLEGRLKSHAEQSEAHSTVVGDLKKEITKLKELNAQMGEHTTEIEARLAKSETRSTTLIAQLETYEKSAEERERVYRDLEKHIEVLDTTNDNKILVEELEVKERRIGDLEVELTHKDSLAGEERAKMLAALEAEKAVQDHLRVQLKASQSSLNLKETSNSSGDSTKEVMVPARSPIASHKELTPPESPASEILEAEAADGKDDETARLRLALEELAARCNAAELRCTEAETKVSDLTSQLSEAKLIRAEMDDVMPHSPSAPALISPGLPMATADDNTADGSGSSGSAAPLVHTPMRASPTPSPTGSIRPSPIRRSSVPTLSTITSVSIQQKRDFRASRGLTDLKQSRPLSLSQELSSAQGSIGPSRTSWAGSRDSLLGVSPSKSPSARTPKSSESLEKELKYMHKVVEERDAELKDREAYIVQLEQTLRTSRQPSENGTASASVQITPEVKTMPLSPLRKVHDAEDASDNEGENDVELSPQSSLRFKVLKESMMQNGDSSEETSKDTEDRVNELLKEMADKERSQREIIDQQYIQIADLQKTNNKLKEDLYAEPSETMATILALRKERDDLLAAKSDTSRDPVDSSATAVEAAREEHAKELETILTDHAEKIDTLRRDHSSAIEEIRSALEHARQEHQVELEGSREVHEKELDELKRVHSEALARASADQEALVIELEKSLSSIEEQRRQVKMKADQSMFELSRVRDEHQFQRNADLKQIADLQKANSGLERILDELQTANGELQKRIQDIESRYSLRKGTNLPPQGPPPNAPLPPLPPTALPSPIFKSPSSDAHTSLSTRRSSGSTALTAIAEIGAAVAQMPEMVGQVVQKVVAERDSAVSESAELRAQLAADEERLHEAEKRYSEERTKSEDLTKDLHESRKTSSKLRAHLEDARHDNKRVTDECKDHMIELEQHRSRMNKMSEESDSNRDSLMAANAQVASLRAQLDRAVETKVNKKLNQRLKCF